MNYNTSLSVYLNRMHGISARQSASAHPQRCDGGGCSNQRQPSHRQIQVGAHMFLEPCFTRWDLAGSAWAHLLFLRAAK